MIVTSSEFTESEEIPEKYTCDGKNASPPLTIDNIPDNTKSLVLIVDDPDAPSGTFTHWIVWNIPPNIHNIREFDKPGVVGTNDFGKIDYGGPCPPSGTHRYFFNVYALDKELELSEGSTRDEVENAMKGSVTEKKALIGTYTKK